MRVRIVAVLIGVATWLVYLTTAGGSLGTGDAVAVFEEASAMIDRGAVDVPASQSIDAWRGTDGRYYTPFGLGQPLFDVPFVLAGRALRAFVPGELAHGDEIPKAIVALASTIPAAIAIVFATLLAWRLSGNLTASAITGITIAFGSLLWPYGKSGFSAALTAGALVGGVYGIAAGGLDRRARVTIAGGFGLGLALLTRHEMAIAAVVCLAWLAWQARGDRRLLVSGAAGICVAAGLAMTANVVRFGNPLVSGHRPAFSGAGFIGFLASPSGAFWLYSPIALCMLAALPALRRREPLPWLLTAVVASMGIFYGALDDWLGTRSYGPRYLVPLLPLMAAPLAVWLIEGARMRKTALAICALSVAIQIPAILVDPAKAGIAEGQPSQTIRRDRWEWTPLWLNVRHASRVLPANVEYVTGRAAAPPMDAADSLADRLTFSLDFWWLYLFYLGLVPAFLLPAMVLVPLTAAAALLRAVFRRARAVDRATMAGANLAAHGDLRR